MNKRDALNVLATAQDGFVSRTREGIDVPFLGGTKLPVSFVAQEIDLDLAADAIVSFCASSPALRATLQDRLFSVALQSFEDCDADFASPQAQLEWEAENTGRFSGATVPTRSSEIWPLVNFTTVHIAPSQNAKLGRYIVKVSGDCAWDGEHGVAATFDGNGNLVGVGEG